MDFGIFMETDKFPHRRAFSLLQSGKRKGPAFTVTQHHIVSSFAFFATGLPNLSTFLGFKESSVR